MILYVRVKKTFVHFGKNIRILSENIGTLPLVISNNRTIIKDIKSKRVT